MIGTISDYDRAKAHELIAAESGQSMRGGLMGMAIAALMGEGAALPHFTTAHRIGPGQRTNGKRKNNHMAGAKPYGVRTKGYAPHGTGRKRD